MGEIGWAREKKKPPPKKKRIYIWEERECDIWERTRVGERKKRREKTHTSASAARKSSHACRLSRRCCMSGLNTDGSEVVIASSLGGG